MAIPVKYQKFKSAGIYRLVYDKSTVLGTEAELLRLVVGYSPKGPFNTPVYVTSETEFKSIFGEGSKTLEKRGCFFHRLAIHALTAGPILCLNLKPFTTESVKKLGIHETFSEETINVKSLFDTTRFWKLEPDNLNDSRCYMHIASIDSLETSNSIFIRKASDSIASDYNITISDWYRQLGEDVPEFLEGRENTLLKDYFTEIYVFKGKFDINQISIETNPLHKYFDVYETYTEEDLVQIPDGSGIWYVKETCNYDEDSHTYSLRGSVEVEPVYISVDNADDETKNDLLYSSEEVTEVEDKYYVTTSLDPGFVVTENSIEVTVAWYKAVNSNKVYFPEVPEGEPDGEAVLPEVKTVNGKLYLASTLGAGDEVYPESIRANVGDYKFDFGSYDESFDRSFDTQSMLTEVEIKNTIKNAFGDDIDALNALYNDSNSGAVGHYYGCVIPNFYDPNKGYMSIDILFNSDSDNHYMMMSLDEDMLNADDFDNSLFDNLIALKEQSIDYKLSPLYIEGYTFLKSKPTDSTPGAKSKWQKDIINVLVDEKGLRGALLSPAEINYRYIVDTFESYFDGTEELKAIFATIAKEKELCFAINNFYSVSGLMKQASTTFGPTGVFDVNKIVTNVKLPSENNGASFCAFYTPLKFSDGYIDTIVPSAGLVSNLFMAKYNGRAPYNIVAGPNYGNIQYSQLVGPDYHYSQDELHVIEPFGVNCMIYRPTFGTFINANQTAKQTPKSALSSINVRELVIYLQDEIGKILQANQWEFNNATTRDAIKTKADIICEQTKKNGGLIWYQNTIDESNNTGDIIDNEMCVLSTEIEPGRGMGKMIHELTIYRTGQMSSRIVSE